MSGVLCELRNASERSAMVENSGDLRWRWAARSWAKSIRRKCLRLTEKLFEAGDDMVAIADTVGYAATEAGLRGRPRAR